MPRDAVPAPEDLLCERCGYRLNGLPDAGRCPECGYAVAHSTSGSSRCPPLWEAGLDRAPARFQLTALAVLRHPSLFFKTMTAHGDSDRSARFGRLAILPAVLFNTKTVLMHCIVMHLVDGLFERTTMVLLLFVVPVAVALAWAGMYAATVRLTTLESRYWGMRLPVDVVRRGLHYDAVHASAAALLPWAVTLVYLCLVVAHEANGRWIITYLYTLSGAVVIAAIYLFAVYAAAMKGLRYANR